MTRVVLASGSPRRRVLLEALGVALVVQTSHVDEVDDGAPPAELVEANAVRKRDAVAAQQTDAVVIAADTLVYLEDAVLSKPRDLDEARAMLRRLSGRTHRVVTGVAVCDTHGGQRAHGHETTEVTFRRLSETDIGVFVESVRPVDRAGAYTCEGPGSLLVAGFRGCYYNVLGLPLVRLDALLAQTGHSLFEWVDAERAQFT